jgi:cell division protein FtsX
MDTAKIITLRQVNQAIADVDAARNAAKTDNTMPQDQKDDLDDTSVLLRQLLNHILLEDEQAFIKALDDDTVELKELIKKIDAASKRLSSMTGTLQKIATAVGALVSIATMAVSAGLVK